MLEVDSSGVIRATGNLEEFARASQNAARSASEVSDRSNSLDSAMNQISLSSLAAQAGVSQLLGALKGMASAVAGFAKDSVQSFSSFEQIQNSLGGVMKDAQKGKELFEDLRKFSFDTTFGVDTLANAASQLISTGTAADDLKKRLKQLGDVAGGDTNKFNDLVSIMAKIQNTGKAGSMQLQQLALRGVPIYQMLKEMGVEGTATSDQIVEAFERMTSAGGQFYNSMQSINETIQGKEGFISDTWREFLTSFAEASGLADAYKSALDVIYEALQGVVDWLQEINANPVGKAIFQGGLVAILTAVAAAILGTVIPALITVISKLTIIAALKAAINPVGLALGAVAGLAAGAAVAIAGLVDKTEEVRPDVFEEMARAMDDAGESAGNLADKAAEIQAVLGSETADAFRENLEGMDERIIRTVEEMTGSLSGSMQGVDWRTLDIGQISQNYRDMYGGEETELEQLVAKYREMEQSALGLYDVIKRENVELEKQNHIQQMIQENEQKRLESMESIHELYKKTDEYKKAELASQIADLQKLLTEGRETIYQKYDDKGNLLKGQYGTYHKQLEADEKAEVQAILRMLNKQLDPNYYKHGGGNDLVAVMKDVLGVDAGKLVSGRNDITWSNKYAWGYQRGDSFIKSNKTTEDYGTAGINAFLEGLELAQKRTEELRTALGEAPATAEERLETEREELKTLVTTMHELEDAAKGLEGGGGLEETGAVIKTLNDEIEKQKQAVAKAEAAALEERYQKELESLNAEREMIGLTEQERQAREYVNQGFSETQAHELASVKAETQRLKLFTDEKKNLVKRAELIGLSGVELRKHQLIQSGLNEMEAEQLALMEKSVDAAERLAKARSKGERAIVMKELAAEVYKENGSMTRAQRSDYVAGTLQEGLNSILSGTDVGAAVEGYVNGGWVGALIETLVGALVKVVKSFDNFDTVMNAVTIWMEKLAPLLEFVFDILEMAVSLVSALLDFLRPLMILIQWVGNLLKATVGKALEKLAEWADGFVKWFMELLGIDGMISDEKQKELDRLKELNKQYQSLSLAIDEQNQYYLRQKQLVNAQAYDRLLGQPVNDLIISPNGTFSTHPEDTIFAMKHPESLAYGGGMSMNVKIYNERGGDTDVSVTQGKNENEMIVRISKKVAGDYALGVNGWDGAEAYRERRRNGRRVLG